MESLNVFLGEPALIEILARITKGSWIEPVDGGRQAGAAYQLTDEGRQRHAVILAAQKEVRLRAMQGISEAEYVTVIRVLQRIVNNLSEDGSPSDPGDDRSA